MRSGWTIEYLSWATLTLLLQGLSKDLFQVCNRLEFQDIFYVNRLGQLNSILYRSACCFYKWEDSSRAGHIRWVSTSLFMTVYSYIGLGCPCLSRLPRWVERYQCSPFHRILLSCTCWREAGWWSSVSSSWARGCRAQCHSMPSEEMQS